MFERNFKPSIKKTKQNKTKEQHDSSKSASETNENVYILVFVSSIGACISVQHFFDAVENQTSKKIYVYIYLELMKKTSKVYEKNIPTSRSLNLDQ